MAILLRGKTQCGICSRVIGKDDEVVSFPAFVGNELDPLVKFSDASFHRACIASHPMAKAAQERLESTRKLTEKKECHQCGREISDPDDYFAFDHFGPEGDPRLSKVSRQQFHMSCLPRWAELSEVTDLLVNLKRSGRWRGRSIDVMIDVLQNAKK